VVTSTKYASDIVFPFFSDDDLHYMIYEAGSKRGAIDKYGPQSVHDAIAAAPLLLALSKILFILVYVGIFEFLTISFGIIAVKQPVADLAL
jgi:hypothetical protein